MSQNYSDAKKVNVFKIAILFFIQEHNFSFEDKTIKELSEYIYRFVIDLDFLRELTSNVILQNIFKYSPEDLNVFIEEELISWKKEGKGYLEYSRGLLKTSYSNVILDKEKEQLQKVITAICIKLMGINLQYKSKIELSEIVNISSVEEIKKSRVWNRAIEKNKYCMCCDDSDIQNLYAVYIYKTVDEKMIEIYTDPNNTLVLCKNHSYLYENGYFRFDKSGHIVIIKNHISLDRRMRISRIGLTDERIKYLSKIA